MENELSILLVEDDVLIGETLRLMLEDFGYHVTGVCYTYAQALDAVCRLDYDLLITDINLGDGLTQQSGLTLIGNLDKLKKVPFIFLTAFDDRDTIRQAAALKPSAYLTKPVKPVTLYAAIQVAVENFSTNQMSSATNKHSSPAFMYVKVGKRLLKLFWSDVYLLESIKNYVLIRTARYDYGIPIRSSLLSVMHEMMPTDQKGRFVKINRRLVIVRTIIRSWSDTQVETIHGVFTVSADFKDRSGPNSY